MAAPRWVVGIDGSEVSLAALRWAVVHGPTADAEVQAVSAFHVPMRLSLLAAKRGFDVDRLGIEAETQHLLDDALAEVGTESVQPIAIEGQPSAVLLEAAEDADLLVVGRRGHGGLRHLVLGSVSTYCATHSGQTPVVVVPPEWDEDRFDTVVVGFDGSPNAQSALSWAVRSTPDDITIRAIIAIEPAPWLNEDITLARFPDEVREEEQRIMEAAALADPDHRAEREVLLHGPRHALAEAAGHTDLIVVGARGHGRIGAALLGSVSTWLLHNAPCPVVVVPRLEDDR